MMARHKLIPKKDRVLQEGTQVQAVGKCDDIISFHLTSFTSLTSGSI